MVTSALRDIPPSHRILVIEDDYANRLLFSDYLTYAGFTVLAIADGQNLSQYISTFVPDLILLDLGLPGVDGYHLLEELNPDGLGPVLPVVIVSGYAFQENQRRAIALGAAEYLVKPVRLKELVQTIRAVLAANPV